MKRAIIQSIIFFVLFSGIAWATNSHAEAFIFPDEEINLDNSAINSQHYINFEYNDHACHGSIHLSTIPATSFNSFYNSVSNPVFHYLAMFHSISHKPPTPPPVG